jgi:hypothetical protein
MDEHNGSIIKITYHAGESSEMRLDNPVIQFVYEGDITPEKIKAGIIEWIISYDVSADPSGSYSD